MCNARRNASVHEARQQQKGRRMRLVLLYSAGLLLFASVAAGIRKLAFQVSAKGYEGKVHMFQKPLFTALLGALANAALFLIVAAAHRLTSSPSHADLPFIPSPPPSPIRPSSPLLVPTKSQDGDDVLSVSERTHSGFGSPRRHVRASDFIQLLVPSICFFAFVVLTGFGMLYIPASMAFMVQASCIIFTSICSVHILNRELNGLHIKGIVASMLGVCIVTVAGLCYSAHEHATPMHKVPQHLYSKLCQLWALAAPSGNAAHAQSAAMTAAGAGMDGVSVSGLVFGISLTLLSQLAQALQFVTEEQQLAQTDLEPTQVMGVEGITSAALSVMALGLASFLPGMDVGGVLENLQDTVLQLRSSPVLVMMCLTHFLSVALNNWFGLRVSVKLGSVFRTVLLSLRTLLIWLANLAIFYGGIGGGMLGEHWDNVASPIELCGFAVLLLGTILYSQGSSTVARMTEVLVQDIDKVVRVLSAQADQLPAPDDVSLLGLPGLSQPSFTSQTSWSTANGKEFTLRLPDESTGGADAVAEPLLPSKGISSPALPVPGLGTGRGVSREDGERRLPTSPVVRLLQSAAGASPAAANGPRNSLRNDLAIVTACAQPAGVLPDARTPRTPFAPQALDFQPAPVATQGPTRVGAKQPSGPGAGPAEGPQGAPAPAAAAAGDSELVKQYVDLAGKHRKFPSEARNDVQRELLIRSSRNLRSEPSVAGTLKAKTSWVLPAGAADVKLHKGASSYQNPFVPQISARGEEEGAGSRQTRGQGQGAGPAGAAAAVVPASASACGAAAEAAPHSGQAAPAGGLEMQFSDLFIDVDAQEGSWEGSTGEAAAAGSTSVRERTGDSNMV